MNGKKARLCFLATCIILAILMLTRVLTNITGGAIFAVALATFGGLSKGFRRT